jgi:hypothetical protein
MPIMRLSFLLLAAVLAVPLRAEAGAKETYILQVTRVDLAKGVPEALTRQVSSRLARAIEAHPDLDGEMPRGAPDPAAEPEQFKAYLKKRKQRAFKVNVEVTEYASTVEPAKGGDQLLTVRVELRVFGETIPDRVMAFTGDGSATIKIEIGKQLRPKDQDYANDEALDLAVADALKTSIARLREPPPSQQKKPRKK